MFQFRRFPSIRYGLAYGCMRYAHAGFPIQTSADQWIFAPPAAFRSLSRLSSALSAKASTLRSFLLGHSDLIALTSDGWCCLVCFYFIAVFLQRLVSSLSYVLRILDVSYMQFSRYIKMRAYRKQLYVTSLLV